MSTTTALTTTETISLAAVSWASIAVLANTFRGEGEPLIASIAFSALAFAACYALIRWLGDAFMRRGFKGKDLCKAKKTEIPETMGACIVLLGIGDDLFDIRWRHKVLIPAVASIPMLIVYFVDFGVTQMVVPLPLRPYLGELFDLGWLYYIYMALLSIFSSNSINILAGINGIEVAQSIVIAVLIAGNDMLYLSPFTTYPHPATDSHLFSLYFLLPFIGVSLALLKHNWFPAKVFVGDTYCYFAGMVFAVVAILGHFSKTLILLLLPQAFNFAYSAPQLFHIIPCPRHRLPHFNARTGLMEASRVQFQRPLQRPIAEGLKLLHRLRLLDVEVDGKGQVLSSSNFTLINLWLVWFGPMREDRLALGILAFQFAVGVLGLFIRHRMALLIFTADNW
ncbi:tunicamycin resistance protein [Curvularia kusanoi]|uniref:UDP-N-acetylglucosamine--dolichyl-phosphate N-acetylglucosaminephosphotransferase n=1 Tax=Curvularia kusanoi TaxID=90978 RepID=A0A9P4TB55_CURKU|nr:tunicamycin resistance protein [Curvularia kusanoi]